MRIGVPLLTLLAVLGSTLAPADAATSRTITAVVSAGTAAPGVPVGVSGRVTKTGAKAKVRIQRLDGGAWATIRTVRTKKRGTYAATIANPGYGSYSYRALAPKRGRLKVAASGIVRVTSAAPAAGTGTVGAVRLNLPMILGSDSALQVPPYTYTRYFTTSGFTAGTSAASTHQQLVSASYAVQTIDASTNTWVKYLVSPTYQGLASGSGTLAFPAWTTYNSGREPEFANYYRIAITILWTDVTTGATLGYETLVPSQVGEVACNTTPYIPCDRYAGYIHF